MSLCSPIINVRIGAVIIVVATIVVLAGFMWYRHLPSVNVIFLQRALDQENSDNQYRSLVNEAHRATVAGIIRRINAQGGVGGYRIVPRWVDTGKEDEISAQVDAAVSKYQPIAVVGETSSQRGQHVARTLAPRNIPYFGIFSLSKVPSLYSNVFLLTPSTEMNDPVRSEHFSPRGLLKFRAAAFIGSSGNIHSETIRDALTREGKWFTVDTCKDATPLPEEVIHADVIVVSCGTQHNARIIMEIRNNGGRQPIYADLIYLKSFLAISNHSDLGELYNLSSFLGNDDIRVKKLHSDPDLNLQFYALDDIKAGALRADAVGLLAEAVRRSNKSITDRHDLAAAIREGLNDFIDGAVYRGVGSDIAFSSDRAVVRESWLLWKTPARSEILLAPSQFGIRNGEVVPIDVAYMDIDLLAVREINFDNFVADMMITAVSKREVMVDALRFANVATTGHGGRQIDILKVSDNEASISDFRERIYYVSGRFTYSAALADFPFDRQELTIDITPADVERPLLIQPVTARAEDRGYDIDGWRPLSSYVGSKPEIISFIDPVHGKHRHRTVHKHRFSFDVKRDGGDFLFKVALPLISVLLLAYLSTLLPDKNIDSKMTVQVSSLLTVIALYFTIQKPEGNTATIADRLIIWSVVALTFLISLSITRARIKGRGNAILRAVKLAGFPLLLTPGGWALMAAG